MITARSLPNPDVLGMLVDERMGLPSGEAALAGYERMMASWVDLGPTPALAPIRTPEHEVRLLQLIEKNPGKEKFFSEDLLQMSAEKRAERIRELVQENPGLERFVHSSILEGSDLTRERTAKTAAQLSPEQIERFSDLIEKRPQARRFFHETVLERVDAHRAQSSDPEL
jgi:hypothetical protein